ncbi:MAG: class II fumarate hydratase [Bacteriovoracaceae bacterium]
MKEGFRIEKDTFGEINVPIKSLWGAQTQRSIKYFSISYEKMDWRLIRSLILIKKAAAEVNGELRLLTKDKVDAIKLAADAILSGNYQDEFPLSVWQTGSGTQTNMNVNEVLANLGSEILGGQRGEARFLHPNDDINKGQSSNDVFPTAMNMAATEILVRNLIPSVENLRNTFKEKSREFWHITKMGRTHLMDATPLTLGQEFSGYVSQLDHAISHLKDSLHHTRELALGGTAVGTGLNTSPEFSRKVIEKLSLYSGLIFVSAPNKFESLAAHDSLVNAHGALKSLAASLFKIANDIRWLASGPRGGLGEIILPANEPGSSIMPGKVNPTQCEALLMICAQVMGNDVAINFAGANGNFELNTFRPIIIHNFLQSARLLSEASASFERFCVQGISVREKTIKIHLEESLMLVTALAPHIGYDRASEIAKKAYNEDKTLKDAANELGYVSNEDFERWVKPLDMTNLPQFH